MTGADTLSAFGDLPSLNLQYQSAAEQYFCLPGRYSWQQFKKIQTLLEQEEVPGLRLFYLDGCIEFMTISPEHEIITSILSAILVFYFIENNIPFIPTGSATLEAEAKGSSAEADLSYYLTQPRTGEFAPELAIEIVLTSGTKAKLARYQRFGVKEGWFWKAGEFSLYSLQGNEYQWVDRSQLLPNLDITFLSHCLTIQDATKSIQTFRAGIG